MCILRSSALVMTYCFAKQRPGQRMTTTAHSVAQPNEGVAAYCWGPESKHTLATLGHASRTHHRVCNWVKGEKLLRMLVARYRRTMGENHVKTIDSRDLLVTKLIQPRKILRHSNIRGFSLWPNVCSFQDIFLCFGFAISTSMPGYRVNSFL